jgi:hypothetical protein
MAEQQSPDSTDPSEVPGRLHEIAQLLRTTHHLGPEAQRALAELADELADILDPNASPPAEAAPLVESTAHVVEALHHDQGTGPLTSARGRLEKMVAAFEGRAPRTVDFARRLLDVLANLGI